MTNSDMQTDFREAGDARHTVQEPNRPRILYLAYYFPPVNTIACVRTWNTAMCLARLGWEVTVVTPDPAIWRSAERVSDVAEQIKSAGIRRILTGHRWRFLSPEYLKCRDSGLARLLGGACRRVARRFDISMAVGWNAAVVRACASLRRGDVDVILATGPPFNTYEIARRLARRLAVPYVLDYRDNWSVGEPHPPRPGFPMKRTVRREQRVLSDCAATLMVSPSNEKLIGEAFGVADKLHVVSNGYNPEEMQLVVPHNFEHFAIVYAGSFRAPWRVADPLMAALARLPADLPPWRLHYYGRSHSHIREAAERYEVMPNVVIHGAVSRMEALAAVKGAGVAVVITTVSETSTLADRGIVTGKVFESIGLGTPILVVAPPGSDLEIIAENTGLARRFTGTDIGGIAAFLSGVIRGAKPEAKNTEAYSWPNLAKRIDGILRNVINANGQQ